MHEFNRCTGGQSLLAMASGGAQFGGAEKEVDDAAKQKPWFVRRFRPAQLERGELEQKSQARRVRHFTRSRNDSRGPNILTIREMSGNPAETKAQCEPTEPTEGPTDFPRIRRL